MGLRLLYVTTRVQKVRFKRKKPRDHEENKSKKYSVIKYKGLEEKMSLLGFFSKKVVCVFAFEAIRSIVNLHRMEQDTVLRLYLLKRNY